MLNVYTAHYRYRGGDRVDITVKTATRPWSIFAPTWSMVKTYQRTLNEKVYTKAYNIIIAEAFKKRERALLTFIESGKTITFVCFCLAGTFCHRVLLAKHFESLGAIYHGERIIS